VLSGKPVELGPAQPEGLVDVGVSCQAGTCPGGGGALVVSQGAGAWWGVSEGRGSGCPTLRWGSAGTEGQISHQVVGLWGRDWQASCSFIRSWCGEASAI
jgi:hypothetical protein